MDIKKDFEKILVIILSLLAIVFAGLLFRNIFSFNDKHFTMGDFVKKEVDDVEMAATSKAIERLNQKVNWRPPFKGQKPFPLMVSTPRVLSGGQIYDLTLSEPKLRPPVPNSWLLENQLSFQKADVLMLDEDSDGFSNFEEYKAGTNPFSGVISGKYLDPEQKELKGKESRPPLLEKLSVFNLSEEPYKIELKSVSGDRINIKEVLVSEGLRSRSAWLEIGEPFFKPVRKNATPLRFNIIKVGQKEVKTKMGIRNRFFAVVKDLLWGDEITLNEKESYNLPKYFVEFSYTRYGDKRFTVERGEKFTMKEHDSEFGARIFRVKTIKEKEVILEELNPNDIVISESKILRSSKKAEKLAN